MTIFYFLSFFLKGLFFGNGKLNHFIGYFKKNKTKKNYCSLNMRATEL